MKQFAGLALVAASMLAGCVEGADLVTEISRADQVAYLVNGGKVVDATTPPSGKVNYRGAIADAAFAGGFNWQGDPGVGITGTVDATIDFDADTLAMELSRFHDANTQIPGGALITASATGANPTVVGVYNNQVINAVLVDYASDIGQDEISGLRKFAGQVMLKDGPNLVFGGMFAATEITD